MDYTWDGIKGGGTSPYEKGKYMPILRNHRYIFTIKEVKGPGFATLNEAVTSPDNFTNHNIGSSAHRDRRIHRYNVQ